jgi:hypothetical protein
MKKFLLYIIILFITTAGKSQITYITGTPGGFECAPSEYVQNMQKEYRINTEVTDQCVTIFMTYDIDYNMDYLMVVECDNNYTPLRTIGYATDFTGMINVRSNVPNGKLIVQFYSEGGYYGSFAAQYQAVAAPANSFSISGPVSMEAYSTTPNLTITDHAQKSMGSVMSTTTDYDKSTILLKSGPNQLGIGFNKISSTFQLGLSANYLYQTSSYSYQKATSFYFSTPNVASAFEINDYYYYGIRMNRPVFFKIDHVAFATASGHGCIYFGNAGVGDLWFRASNTTGSINAYRDLMVIKNNGNVLIGKISQRNTDYKLDVEGLIRATGAVYNTDGADFVFDDNYNLRSLAEVEAYIKEHKHLPEIAPAEDMRRNGVNVAELQTRLLQKVEELTLYVIEQEKKLEAQEKKNAALEQEVKELKKLVISNK